MAVDDPTRRLSRFWSATPTPPRAPSIRRANPRERSGFHVYSPDSRRHRDAGNRVQFAGHPRALRRVDVSGMARSRRLSPAGSAGHRHCPQPHHRRHAPSLRESIEASQAQETPHRPQDPTRPTQQAAPGLHRRRDRLGSRSHHRRLLSDPRKAHRRDTGASRGPRGTTRPFGPTQIIRPAAAIGSGMSIERSRMGLSPVADAHRARSSARPTRSDLTGATATRTAATEWTAPTTTRPHH